MGWVVFFFTPHVSKAEEQGNFTAAEKQNLSRSAVPRKPGTEFARLVASALVRTPPSPARAERRSVNAGLCGGAGGLGPSLWGADERRLRGES